jgi:hypothetical protein
VELGNIEIDVSPKHNFPCYSPPPPYFGLPVVASKWWPGSPFEILSKCLHDFYIPSDLGYMISEF